MERKFKHAVAMIISEDQYPDLSAGLNNLGYKPYEYHPGEVWEEKKYYLSTKWSTHENGLYFLVHPGKDTFDSYFGDTIHIDYNPELFLALAAISEGDEFFPGEWVICQWKGSTQFAFNGLFQVSKIFDEKLYAYPESKSNWMYLNSQEGPNFRKATLEELVNHFTKTKEEQPAEEEPWIPQYGDIIEVWEDSRREERQFVGFNHNSEAICRNGKKFDLKSFAVPYGTFDVTTWPYWAKPKSDIEMQSQEVVAYFANLYNVSEDRIKIKP